MTAFFSKKPKSYLGVDVGTASIKIVQLGAKGERPNLETYGLLEIYSSRNDAQTDSLQILDKEVASLLKEVVKESKATTKTAVASVPVHASFSTMMEIPEMSEKEIDSAINFEAKQYIPVPLNEVVMDWQILGKKVAKPVEGGRSGGSPQEQNKLQVFLVAVPKETINKYTQIMKMAGLNLVALETENFSLMRALLGNDKSPVAIIDIGSQSTDINIIDKGFVRMTRNIETSGTEFTRVLTQGLNLSYQRAEMLKRERGLKKDMAEKEISDIMLPIIDVISNEIERLVDSYSRKDGQKIERVILVGGSARLPGLTEYFSQRLKIETNIGNPWSRLTYPQILKPVLQELAPSFAVSVGSAMRELVSS